MISQIVIIKVILSLAVLDLIGIEIYDIIIECSLIKRNEHLELVVLVERIGMMIMYEQDQ